jgi:acyl dehydratase
MSDLFFEDIVVGATLSSGPYAVLTDDVVGFAIRWDPLPIHVDPDAAVKSPFGALTAAGIHTLAIKQVLMHRLPIVTSVLCTLGFDEVRFPQPLYAGRSVTLTVAWLEKRISKSRPDRGIVRLEARLATERGEIVLTYQDTILMLLRAPNLSSEA